MFHNLGVRIAGVAVGSAIVLGTAFQAEAAPRRHYRGGNGGAAAAVAIGALALGVGAAIASSQRNDSYYAPAYGYGAYPAYGYGGYPAYGYTQPQVYYAPQPAYQTAYPAYYGYGVRRAHRGNHWQRVGRDQNRGF